MSPSRRAPVHVTIHDVGPAFARQVDDALELCAKESIRPGLLVVPNHHGQAPLELATDYAANLRALARSGCELFLHGYFHRADAPDTAAKSASGRVDRWFRQTVVSGGEAEFASLDRERARDRLDLGMALMARLDLPISGFVPPAWSMRRWLIPMLAERGIRFCETHVAVMDPVRGIHRPSLVLNYASRSLARIASTVAFCRVAKHAAIVPTRVAIHPKDLDVPLLRSEVQRLLAWAAPRAVPTAAELFE
jgi:predicted deacetylase